MSMTRNGRNSRKPIWNAFDSSLTRNAEQSVCSGTWARAETETAPGFACFRAGIGVARSSRAVSPVAVGSTAGGFQPVRSMNSARSLSLVFASMKARNGFTAFSSATSSEIAPFSIGTTASR